MDNRRRNLRKIGIDFTILCCVGFPLLFLWLLAEPFKRGFFCNDDSIRHPFRNDTVENWVLGLIATLLPILVIGITEFVKAYASRDIAATETSMPTWLLESCRHTGYLLYCHGCTLLLTFIGKYSIGRFRPHFYSVCLPVMPNGSTCSDAVNLNRYIEDFTCSNSDATAYQLIDMRQSFPSGHASLSACAMVYCVMYLQARMNWRGSQLSRHFIQLLLVIIAVFTGLSRVSDYMHHWSDVLVGLILGTVVAIIIATSVSDMFTEHRRRSELVLPQIKTNAQNGNILYGESS